MKYLLFNENIFTLNLVLCLFLAPVQTFGFVSDEVSAIEGSFQLLVCAKLVSLGPLVVPVEVGVRLQSGSAIGTLLKKIYFRN